MNFFSIVVISLVIIIDFILFCEYLQSAKKQKCLDERHTAEIAALKGEIAALKEDLVNGTIAKKLMEKESE